MAIASLIGFYAWAGHDATTEPADQARLRVGVTAMSAEDLLPSRQAPVRLVDPPAHPDGWDCRSYTNGNFPLAIATLEVCFDHARIVRVTNLASRSPW